ncbi:methylthioribose-1-phosphate isomerase, partial [Achromatium sp. WMS2]
MTDLRATPDTAIIWDHGRLLLLDQRLLPQQEVYLALTDLEDVSNAIRNMVVRGAPAIGIAAAYAVAMEAKICFASCPNTWVEQLLTKLDLLAKARPTAVNLMWSLDIMRAVIRKLPANVDPSPVLTAEACAVHLKDATANRNMGAFGADLISKPTAVITHCNAGALATGGYGTALGVIRSAYAAGNITQVYADETRPWLQGSRLTAWELLRDNIPTTLMADAAAAFRMARGDVGWVIVGADRIAANGDFANKIGTYQLAVTARHHGVKFMVAAPMSTIDVQTPNGNLIPIEERGSQELL